MLHDQSARIYMYKVYAAAAKTSEQLNCGFTTKIVPRIQH